MRGLNTSSENLKEKKTAYMSHFHKSKGIYIYESLS